MSTETSGGNGLVIAIAAVVIVVLLTPFVSVFDSFLTYEQRVKRANFLLNYSAMDHLNCEKTGEGESCNAEIPSGGACTEYCSVEAPELMLQCSETCGLAF